MALKYIFPILLVIISAPKASLSENDRSTTLHDLYTTYLKNSNENIDVGSLAAKGRLDHFYMQPIPQKFKGPLSIEFKVVWKDGSYSCTVWFEEFQSPISPHIKYRIQKVIYRDNGNQPFQPKSWTP
jgi:hypothetical protein